MIRNVDNAKRRRTRRISAVLILVMVATFIGPVRLNQAGSSDTAKLVQKAMESQSATVELLDEISEQLADLSVSVDMFSGELEWLNQKGEEEVAHYERLLREKEAALRAVDDAISAYLRAEADLAAKEQEYHDRLQVMFEYRDKPVIEVFLESGNIQGFFTNMEIIRAVADYDDQMLEDMEACRIEAEIKRQDALQKQGTANALVKLKEAELDELQDNISRSSSELDEAQALLAEQQAREEELLRQSEELADAIRVLQAQQAKEEEAERRAAEERRRLEAARRALAGYGTFSWPVPTSTWITSPFQPYGRTDLPGQTRPHLGVDIAAPFNTPITAAADGHVMMVYNPAWQGWYSGGSGYGNYVIVDHGNGIATLYAHLRFCEVAVGDYVLAGDVVGLMGSTGNSTGSHLHFEVRVNGTPVDPLQSQYIGTP